MINKFPTILALVAAIVVTFISIITRDEFLVLVFRLIITIICFYALGFIVKLFLVDIFQPQVEEIDVNKLDSSKVDNSDLDNIEDDSEIDLPDSEEIDE